MVKFALQLTALILVAVVFSIQRITCASENGNTTSLIPSEIDLRAAATPKQSTTAPKAERESIEPLGLFEHIATPMQAMSVILPLFFQPDYKVSKSNADSKDVESGDSNADFKAEPASTDNDESVGLKVAYDRLFLTKDTEKLAWLNQLLQIFLEIAQKSKSSKGRNLVLGQPHWIVTEDKRPFSGSDTLVSFDPRGALEEAFPAHWQEKLDAQLSAKEANDKKTKWTLVVPLTANSLARPLLANTLTVKYHTTALSSSIEWLDARFPGMPDAVKLTVGDQKSLEGLRQAGLQPITKDQAATLQTPPIVLSYKGNFDLASAASLSVSTTTQTPEEATALVLEQCKRKPDLKDGDDGEKHGDDDPCTIDSFVDPSQPQKQFQQSTGGQHGRSKKGNTKNVFMPLLLIFCSGCLLSAAAFMYVRDRKNAAKKAAPSKVSP